MLILRPNASQGKRLAAADVLLSLARYGYIGLANKGVIGCCLFRTQVGRSLAHWLRALVDDEEAHDLGCNLGI
jgi:hypothetical protein